MSLTSIRPPSLLRARNSSSETRSFRITQTAKLFSRHCKTPILTRQAQILLAAKALTDALLHKEQPNLLHPPNTTALQQLAKIFQQSSTPPNNRKQNDIQQPNIVVGAERVDTVKPQRVQIIETPSHSPTNNTSTQFFSHVRSTRNNTPVVLTPDDMTPPAPLPQRNPRQLDRQKERALSKEPPLTRNRGRNLARRARPEIFLNVQTVAPTTGKSRLVAGRRVQ